MGINLFEIFKSLKSGLLVLVALLFCISVDAQKDSTMLSYDEFLNHIVNHHPLAKKANLKLKLGEAKLQSARGNLDPILSSGLDQKSFDKKLYYRDLSAKLKIPTRLGIDIVGGYENTEGVRLNPQRYTDENGLWYAGVEINVLQGLLVNERKVALKQAKVYQQMAINEQQILLNDLIYNASFKYLMWQQYYFYKQVLKNNLSLANTYLDNTLDTYYNGDKTAMDTLEARIVYQDAQVLLNKNELNLIKARNDVENYLWFNQLPVVMQETTIPENYKNNIFKEVNLNEIPDLSKHPIIQASLNNLNILEIEQRLKREKLKPKLKVKYNALLATSENSISPSYSESDFKWGFDFSMPLLLRGERGKINQGKVKIQELELSLENKRNELKNKLESSLQNQVILRNQINILKQSVDGYMQLMNGENEKYKYGESSVFLLNKRQEKYINGYLKLVETYIKKQKEIINFLYLSNQLVG